MWGPEFWSRVHAWEHDRGNRPCSTLQKRRVTSLAAEGIPWNDALLLLRPGLPPAPPRHLACRIRGLKENHPCDKKLQALKNMILAQRRRCVPRHPEGKTRCTKPLKRKVCKATAFSAPACPGHSERAGKKLRAGRDSAPSSRKAEKGRAVTLFGVSAWREGQNLARKILGPPRKYPNLKSELKSQGKGPFQGSQGDPLTGSQTEQSFGENAQAVQPQKKKIRQERPTAELNHKNNGWTEKRTRRRQKAPDTEKKGENHPRSAGRARTAGSTRASSEGVKTTRSPKVQNASAKRMGMGDTSGPGKRRPNGSFLRSPTPRKEQQTTTTGTEARKKPYSPEQVREFMDQKATERKRRIQEERRTSKQTQEERNRKLQEVYRKQREAASRRRHHAGPPREDLASVTPTKSDLGLKSPSGQPPARDDTKGVCRPSRALLRKESKFNSSLSELEPRMDKTGQEMLGLCTSIDSEGQLRTPLKLKQVDISSLRASHHSPSPFHLWREKVIGMETPFSLDTSASPSFRSKQDRVRAIHNLAKDLSERLGREMERLQATKALRDQGCPPGTPSKRSQMTTPPAAPLENFDAPENAESIWASIPLLNPLMCPQERDCLEKRLGIPMDKEELIQPLLPTDGAGLEVMDSAERRQSRIEAKELKEGLASEMGFRGKDPTGPLTGLLTESGSIYCSGIPKDALGKKQPGGSNPQKKQPENQAGPGGLVDTLQHQPSGFPFPPFNLAPGKAGAAEDPSEPAGSNSQWSEIDHFYGGSSSFGRLSLTLVEQSLREEELRARHQSALLRLREKALLEKAQAELAWLEHGQRSPRGLQGTGDPSSTAEKQLSILTRLKQEQAEIRHLQNIGRAAHQERKLLLQQRKELLEVQKTTTQLWLQLAGQQPHQISLNPPGAEMLEKEKSGTSFKPAPLIAACPRGRERRSSQEVGQQWLAESKSILPPGNQEAEGGTKREPGKGDPSSKILEATIQDLYDPSGQRSLSPGPGDGRTAGHLACREQNSSPDNSLTKHSQEDRPGSSLDKSPGSFASAGTSSILHGFCPYPEKSPSGFEFRKGYAVLVNLSGSSLSASDLEDDGQQDTDVSLPEEYVFQEPLPDNLGVSAHHKAPVVPRIVINTESTLSSSEKKPHGQIPGGDLESEDLCAVYNQEKIWEDAAGTERLAESGSVILPNSGRLQGTCSVTKKDHIHAPTLRSRATSLNVSEERAENGGNKTTSQSPAEVRMVFSSTNDPFQSPEGEGEKDPLPNVTGEDVEDESTSHCDNKDATVTLASGVSLNTGTPQDSEQPVHGPKHSLCHRFPNSSDALLVSEDKTSCANRSTEVCVSQKPDKISLQLNKTSLGNRDLAEENQKRSSTKNQNTNEAGMTAVHLRSPQEALPKNEGDTMHLNNKLLSELEDDVSPVDEMLTYGSSNFPSSTEKDASSWSTDLPAPPENLTGQDEEATSGLDFPSPPDSVASSEAEELSPLCNLPAEDSGSSLWA